MVVRWLDVKQARVRISARHPTEVLPTEPAAMKIWRRASANVISEWLYECMHCNRNKKIKKEWHKANTFWGSMIILPYENETHILHIFWTQVFACKSVSSVCILSKPGRDFYLVYPEVLLEYIYKVSVGRCTKVAIWPGKCIKVTQCFLFCISNVYNFVNSAGASWAGWSFRKTKNSEFR